jgi:hypothetical protein
MRTLLQRALGLIVGLALAAAAIIWASLILALAAAFALVIGAWLWWRTRELRRRAEADRPAVVEGEYREVDVSRLDDRR